LAYGEKRGSGKTPWRARYKRPDGTLGSEPGFRTKRAAEEWGEDQEAAIRAGRWQDPEKARTPFGEFAPVWMAAQKVAPATSNKRRYLLNRHLLPAFERTRLCEINIFTAQAWANKQTCAPATVNSCLTLLSSILTGAADAGYLLANPMYGRRRAKTDRPEHDPSKQHGAVDHAEDGHAETVWAQPDDVFALYQRLGGVAGLMVVTAAYTGLRWGELAGLHRSNALLKRADKIDRTPFERTVLRIDPLIGSLHEVEFELDEDDLVAWNRAEDERLAVCREKGWKAVRRKEPTTVVKLYLGPPKNKTSAREVDLPPFLVTLWEKHLAEWPHEYVFATEADGKWWRRGNFARSHLRPAADGRKAIPRKRGFAGREEWEPILAGLTMRGLRHTHDTWMKDERVDRALRFETMGWAVSGDIEGVYEHVTPEMRKGRLEALEARWRRGRRVALRAVV
jgi:integrase